MTTPLDLFVVGGGSGGVRAARMAAQRGARVVLAEAARAGRHLRQRRLHPQEALQLRRAYRRRLPGCGGLRLGRGRAALRLGRAQGEPGARDRAPERRLRRPAATAPACRCVRGWAHAGRRPHGAGADRRRRAAAGAPPHPGRHRRHADGAGLPGPRAWRSPPTACSTSSRSRAGWWWWAAATSPASSPRSSSGLGAR